MKKWLLLLLVTSALYGEETTRISSDVANYDGHTIVLKGNVELNNALGQVLAERAVLTRDEEGRAKIDFPWVKLTGKVRATLQNGSHLICEEVFLDYLAMTSLFLGAPELYYKDPHGELYATQATVEYREIEGHIRPAKMVLEGNVQMINAEALQYALADRVEYSFSDEVMVLTANPGKSVLFYDRQKEIQLSAARVQGRRNENGKESIQGSGDVRFLFKQDELTKLKERFHWE